MKWLSRSACALILVGATLILAKFSLWGLPLIGIGGSVALFSATATAIAELRSTRSDPDCRMEEDKHEH